MSRRAFPELQHRRADRDPIAVGQLARLDRLAVEAGAVRGAEVGEDVRTVRVTDLRVSPRRALVADRDLTLRQSPDRHHIGGQDHRARLAVLMDHERRGGRRHRLDLLLALHERRLAAELALLQLRIGLERDLGRTDQTPPALRRVLADDLLQLRDERGLRLLEVLGVGGRQAEDERVRRPDLRDAHAASGVHLLEDALGELDGLQATAEGLGEQSLDQTTESSFEFAEDRHGSTFAQVGRPCASRERFYPSVCCGPVAMPSTTSPNP